MALVLSIFILHGLAGGFDVVCNHEIVEHLPSRVQAFCEQWLHSAREALFAFLFFGLAWREWHGNVAWVIAASILLELAVTTCDTVVEVKTRVLTTTEQVTHVFLLVNFGVFVALLSAQLMQWHTLPSEVHGVDYGWRSRVMTLLSLMALAWSIRDAMSAMLLARRLSTPPAATVTTQSQ